MSDRAFKIDSQLLGKMEKEIEVLINGIKLNEEELKTFIFMSYSCSFTICDNIHTCIELEEDEEIERQKNFLHHLYQIRMMIVSRKRDQ